MSTVDWDQAQARGRTPAMGIPPQRMSKEESTYVGQREPGQQVPSGIVPKSQVSAQSMGLEIGCLGFAKVSALAWGGGNPLQEC